MKVLKNDDFSNSLIRTVQAARNTLRKKEQRNLYVVVLIQLFLSVIDLISLAFIGLLASLTISGVARKPNSGFVDRLLSKLNLSDFDLKRQVVILGLTSVILIVLRTVSSLYLMRKVFGFLSNRSAALSAKIMKLIVDSDVASLRRYSTQEFVYASTFGVEALYLRILAPTYTLIADLTLLSIFGIALLLIDPFSALITLALLILISMILDKIQSAKVSAHGIQSTELDLRSRSRLTEAIESIREIRVRNREKFISEAYELERQRIANSIAFNNWVAYSNKYIVEATLIFGGMLVAGIEFALSDAVKAISSLALFLAASTRMAPAALRIQQSLIQARACLPPALKTIEMIEYLESIKSREIKDLINNNWESFIPEISIKELFVSYKDSQKYALSNINLEIYRGEFFAITGDSGSGKSTLVDAILGLIPIQKGTIKISGLEPSQAINAFPGKISYLPQSTFISNESIRKNITYGYPDDAFTHEQIVNSLKKADIWEWVSSLSEGLESELGESGSTLSGGQRQRIGLARALLSNPTLLILDEATSSLDAESEKRISETVSKLGPDITRIVIAHRLSTIEEANRVLVLENGKISKVGSANEIFNQNSN